MVYDGDDFASVEDIDVVSVSREVLWETVIKTQNEWRDNMDKEGYRNTGEAVNSITPEPQAQGADEYRLGSEKIQVLIGEVGRRPGAPAPPPEELGEWVNEQAGLPDKGDEDFDNAVYNIGQSISENGLPAYRFGGRAFRTVENQTDEMVEKRLDDEMGE